MRARALCERACVCFSGFRAQCTLADKSMTSPDKALSLPERVEIELATITPGLARAAPGQRARPSCNSLWQLALRLRLASPRSPGGHRQRTPPRPSQPASRFPRSMSGVRGRSPVQQCANTTRYNTAAPPKPVQASAARDAADATSQDASGHLPWLVLPATALQCCSIHVPASQRHLRTR